MFAIAKPEKLTEILQDLKIALRACGHRLRMHRCEVWFPGCADVPDDDRTRGQRSGAVGGGSHKETGVQRLDRSWERGRTTTQLAKRQSSVQALIPPVHGIPLQEEARSIDDANESGDARVGPRRQAHSERGALW